MNEKTTITVLGAGYVGLTTATLLAHANCNVYVIEPNAKRLDVIKSGKSFFYEEGLDALIASALEAGTLHPTNSYAECVAQSSVIISSVGTPDNPDGSTNLSYVYSAVNEALSHANEGTIYVQKSTVPVGTGEKIVQLIAESGKDIPYVSNPEFLRESTALSDTLYFDRVVVGSNDNAAAQSIVTLYRQLENVRNDIAQKASITAKSINGRYITTNLNSAELIKVTSNAFLALKISFANSIAKLADKTSADINEVMDAVGADPRIGRSFLDAGRGYGGGCFPKDVSGLITSARQHGVALDIMTAAQALNDSMAGYVVERLNEKIKLTANVTVAVLGLSFKAGTSDVRKSPGVKIANILDRQGAQVKVYDPEALEEAEASLRRSITSVDSIETALSEADAVLIATDWKQFTSMDPKDFAAQLKGTIFVDAVNKFDKPTVEAVGLTYLGIGR